MSSSKAVTTLLTALVAIGSFSIAIYAPSLPSLAQEFGTTPERVKLTLTLFLVGFAVAQLAYGPLSDCYGRRPVLLGGLALYVLGSLACALALSIEAMIASRLLQGLGACAGPAIGRAVVRDLFDRTQMARVLALIAAAVTLSPALGPILGGFLHVWFGWRANFVALTGFGLALFTATLLLLDETNRFRDPSAIEPRRILGAYATLLGHPLYLGYLLAGAAIFAGLLFAWIAGAPFLFINLLGMAPEHYGLVSLITTGAYLAGTLLVAHGRLGLTADGMVLAGAGLTILGGGTMALAGVAGWFNAPAILLPMALFSVGMGLSLPNCMAAGMAPFPRLAGSASAMMGFGQMAFAALATVAIAVLQTGSAIPMGAIITAAGVVSLASFFVLIRPYRHNKPPPTGDRA